MRRISEQQPQLPIPTDLIDERSETGEEEDDVGRNHR